MDCGSGASRRDHSHHCGGNPADHVGYVCYVNNWDGCASIDPHLGNRRGTSDVNMRPPGRWCSDRLVHNRKRSDLSQMATSLSLTASMSAPTQWAQASVQTLQSLFPGTNFVRFATGYQATDMAAEEAYVTSLTQAGIVVEIEDHPYPSPGVYSGAQLQAESAWYAQLAQLYVNNPYVWFGTMNEPSGGSPAGIEDQELATYNAIHGAGSNAILMLELYGGGNPGTIGIPGGMTDGDYANMSNVAFDLHFYGWAVNYSTDPGTISNYLKSAVQQAQTLTGAGGSTIPVIIGEFGNATDGSTMDPDGTQVVAAVLSSGQGYAAWTFGDSGGDIDNLVSGGLTDYGQQVAAGIALIQGAPPQCGLLHAQRQHRSRRPPQDQPPRLPQVNQRLSISKLLPQPINQQPLNRQQRRRRRQTHKSLRLINLLQIRSPSGRNRQSGPSEHADRAGSTMRARITFGATVIIMAVAAWTVLASRLFVWMGGLSSYFPTPWVTWWRYARQPRMDGSTLGYLIASGTIAALPIGLLGTAVLTAHLRNRRRRLVPPPGGGVRPIEGGVTSNYGNARVLADKECLQRYPGPSGVVIGELRAGKAGTAPLVIDPCATGAGHGMLIAGTRAGKTTSESRPCCTGRHQRLYSTRPPRWAACWKTHCAGKGKPSIC